MSLSGLEQEGGLLKPYFWDRNKIDVGPLGDPVFVQARKQPKPLLVLGWGAQGVASVSGRCRASEC